MNTPIISLLVSHNSRIQCYLDKISHNIYPGNDLKRKIRFKNGALLKLTIINNNCMISLIYEGDLGTKQPSVKKPYWISEKNSKINVIIQPNIDQQSTIIFPKIEVPITDINFKLIFGDKFDMGYIDYNTPYIFYIARHGEASHNVVKFFNVNRDTTLTSTGESQVEQTGQELNNDLDILGIDGKVKYIFISDLERTRFTARQILFNVDYRKIATNEMIILPCSHEITTKKSTGNCDIAEKSAKFNPLKGFGSAPENYSKCSPKACTFINKNPADDSKAKIITNDPLITSNRYNLNWNYYQKFYDNKMRGDYSQSSRREKCGENTMIGFALDIITGKKDKDFNFTPEMIKSIQINKLRGENNTRTLPRNYASDSSIIMGGKTKKKRSFNKRKTNRKKRQSYSKKDDNF